MTSIDTVPIPNRTNGTATNSTFTTCLINYAELRIPITPCCDRLVIDQEINPVSLSYSSRDSKHLEGVSVCSGRCYRKGGIVNYIADIPRYTSSPAWRSGSSPVSELVTCKSPCGQPRRYYQFPRSPHSGIDDPSHEGKTETRIFVSSGSRDTTRRRSRKKYVGVCRGRTVQSGSGYGSNKLVTVGTGSITKKLGCLGSKESSAVKRSSSNGRSGLTTRTGSIIFTCLCRRRSAVQSSRNYCSIKLPIRAGPVSRNRTGDSRIRYLSYKVIGIKTGSCSRYSTRRNVAVLGLSYWYGSNDQNNA